MGFAILSDHWVPIKESNELDRYLVFAKQRKGSVEHEGEGDTNFN